MRRMACLSGMAPDRNLRALQRRSLTASIWQRPSETRRKLATGISTSLSSKNPAGRFTGSRSILRATNRLLRASGALKGAALDPSKDSPHNEGELERPAQQGDDLCRASLSLF